MGLTTDFSGAPYFDDFNEEKNFHKILFKPSFAVQARELTQLQTILQNQIERFGDNILKEGTIIKGGNFVEQDPLPYVKITDNNTNNESVVVNRFEGRYAIGTITGVRAIIVKTIPGLETQAPNLNTLYIRYLTTNNDNKVFNSTENLEIRDDADNLIEIVTVAGNSDTNAIGDAYGVRCGDGIIFQKGHFIRFEDELTIVSKYDRNPNDVVVGFETTEETVNSDQDNSLLDNSEGYNNFNAPGADRLRLIPSLVVKTKEEAAADDRFFAIQEYQNGKVVRRNVTTEYNVIQKMVEKRDYERNGNEVINPFSLRLEDSIHNRNNLSCIIGPGLAYVAGKRVETLADTSIDLPKASTTNQAIDQIVSINYGSYVLVQNYEGVFDFKTMEQVELYDISSVLIGTANIRSITKQSNGFYRLYIFNLLLEPNKTFNNARSIISTTSNGRADLIPVDEKIQIVDFSSRGLLFPIGKTAIKNLDFDRTSYTYRTSNTNLECTSTGIIDINLTSTDRFPYEVGTNLLEDQKLDLIIISNANTASYATGEVIDISGNNAVVSVQSETQLQITLSVEPGIAIPVTAYYNAVRTVTQPNNKNLETVYIKIDTTTHIANTTGVYSLGLPDVLEIENIYRVTGNSEYTDVISEDVTDVTNSFNLFANQKDTFYGLSYIASKAGFIIEPEDRFLIKAKVFRKTNSQNSFFSVDSYPVDDTTFILPENKIRTEQIPVFISTSGTRLSLRDCIDFRPYVNNTAVYSSTIESASENPLDTVSFGVLPINLPGPNLPVLTAYEYYLPRIDLLIIDERGRFAIVNGDPAETPTVPSASSNALRLAQINVNAFPSVPSARALKEGVELFSYIFRIAKQRTKAEDIKRIENRLSNLELYASLNLLEKSATDYTVKDSFGLDRFKSGILVDNFEDLSIANLGSSEYSASLDPAYKEISPRFRSYPIDLKTIATSNITDHGQAATLRHTDVQVISQPFATNTRSATTNFWRFNGTMEIFPNSDTTVDTVRAPNTNLSIDLATPFSEYTESLNEFIPLQTVTNRVVEQNTSANARNPLSFADPRSITNAISVVTESITRELQVSGISNENQVGDFVTDVNFNPFLRSREIEIKVFGLRPNTRFYFFFDSRDVNPHVATGRLIENRRVERIENYGQTFGIRSNADGNLFAVFRIPQEEFFVGRHKLEIYDVINYNDRNNASSSAEAAYNGFNISTEKTNLTLTTRIPDFNTVTSIDRSTSTLTSTQNEIILFPELQDAPAVQLIPPPPAPLPPPPAPPNTTPQVFNFFLPVASVNPGEVVTANTVISGLEPNYQITVSAVNGTVDAGTTVLSGVFASTKTVTTSASGTFVLAARTTASNEFNTTTFADITVGTITRPFLVTTRSPDLIPNAFTFTTSTGVQLNTQIISDTVTVSGLEPDYPVVISATGGVIDGGSSGLSGVFETSKTITTSSSGTLVVAARILSDDDFTTSKTMSVTVGSISSNFTAITRGPVITPANPFEFTPIIGSNTSINVTSATITVTGLEPNYPITITASGGTVDAGSIALSGTFASSKTVTTTSSGTLVLAARVASSSNFEESTEVSVTIGVATNEFVTTTRAADITPADFNFASVTGNELSTNVTSSTVTITGLEPNYSFTITASNGLVDAGTSVLSGTFSSSKTVTSSGSGTLVVAARVTTGTNYSTPYSVSITVGSVTKVFTATTRATDTTPAAFNFIDITGAEPSSTVTSSTVTVSGFDPNISVTVTGAGGLVDAGTTALSGTFASSKTVTTSGTGTIVIAARVTASSSFSQSTSVVVTAGTVSDSFNVTTRAAVTTPTAFEIFGVQNVELSTPTTSATITVTGLEPNYPITITASGGTVDAGTTTLSGSFASSKTVTSSATGTIVIAGRVTSSSSFNTSVPVFITIGSLTRAFIVTTRAQKLLPNPFPFNIVTNVEPNTVVTSNIVTVSGVEPNTPINISTGFGALGETGVPGLVDAGTTNLSGTFESSKTVTSSSTGTFVVAVRLTSGPGLSDTVRTSVGIGGRVQIFNVTNRIPDLIANEFSFDNRIDEPLSSDVLSNIVTITGLEPNYPITVSITGALDNSVVPFANFQIDAGTTALSGIFSNVKSVTTSASGTIVVRAKVRTSSIFRDVRTARINIGGRSALFSVTNRGPITILNASNGNFQSLTGQARNTVITSATTTFTGLEPNFPITISGGTIATIDAGTNSLSGTFAASKTVTTSSTGSLVVAARMTSSPDFFTQRTATINIGSSQRTFSVTTAVEPVVPVVPPTPPAPVLPAAQTCSSSINIPFNNVGSGMPITRTFILGTFTGTAGIGFRISTRQQGSFSMTWNGITVTSPILTGSGLGLTSPGVGSLTINKTLRDPQTATVTFTPVDTASARMGLVCPTVPNFIQANLANILFARDPQPLVDPIAQTFIIEPDQSTDNSVFLTGLDLFFARKSQTNGVTVEIREVENGYPTGITVPFSKTHLTANEVFANETSATQSTRVTFETPVSIKTGIEYAIVVNPDANDPNYLLWISRTGGTDVDSGVAVTQDTNAGMVFTSTNNKTWTPYQDENLKFNLYKANFIDTVGLLQLSNPDNEFLTVSSTDDVGFIEGERVYVDPNGVYATGTIAVTAGNRTITGFGTLFPSQYTVGEHIVVEETGEVLRIESITSNTSMIVSNTPINSSENSFHFKTVTGTVSYFNPNNPMTLILENSSAKSGLTFQVSSVIVGSESGERVTITEIRDQKISYMQNNILRNNFARTSTKLKAARLYDGVGYYEKTINFADNNYLNSRPTYIRSRTNEVLAGGEKSFILEVELRTNSTDTSPFIDHQISNTMLYEYIVNNDNSNERTVFGAAQSKYISRKVELASGLDAEDMRVLLTAYQPPGTEVQVWVKFQAETDENEFDDCRCIAWTKLELKDQRQVYSSSANRFDFVELEYVLSDVPQAQGGGAFLADGETFTYFDKSGGVHNNFKFFAVKIVLLSTNHSVVPRVKDMRAIALS